jgi:hypothetical protein
LIRPGSLSGRPAPTPVSYWVPIDPSGRYQNGDRVPFVYPFCPTTTDGKMGMSADPGVAKLSMSPNCAAWEMWFLEK